MPWRPGSRSNSYDPEVAGGNNGDPEESKGQSNAGAQSNHGGSVAPRMRVRIGSHLGHFLSIAPVLVPFLAIELLRPGHV
jgi:hypothetical protein